MTPLPGALGGVDLVAWRLDTMPFAPTWDSGEGAFRFGGRWNNKGVRAVYCAIDPATAILEVAVHKGFRALDAVPHTLTSFLITEPTSVHVVDPTAVPNPNWLRPTLPSSSQRDFGDVLLRQNKFVLFPSAVSSHSWNLVFVASAAAGAYALQGQEPFALDTRLNPPPAA